jgi:hypothetical protein
MRLSTSNFLKAADAMVGRVAKGVRFSVGPAGTEAKDQPPTTDRIGGRGHLREQGRVPEGHAENQLTELDPGCRCGQRGQDRPGLVNAPGGLGRKAEKVVAEPQ